MVASPIHRTFYAGVLRGSGPDRAATAQARRLAGVRTTGDRTALPPGASNGSLPVAVADPLPRRLPVEGVPPGWRLKGFTGTAWVELVRSEIGPALRLQSERASFALYRDVVVDLHDLPMLTWSWKVTRLPTGGDVRRADRDDQGAQLYVIFPRWPSPLSESTVVGYVWDTSAPSGASLPSPKAENVRIIVVESGAGHLGVWRRYQRNVREDYRHLFGHEPPRVGAIAVMVDADDTASLAEALVGGLAFARPTP